MEAVKWATANGYTIVKEYADRAITGTTDDREQFQLMLREMERLRPAVLILWKVDRMGRNKEESILRHCQAPSAAVPTEGRGQAVKSNKSDGLDFLF